MKYSFGSTACRILNQAIADSVATLQESPSLICKIFLNRVSFVLFNLIMGLLQRYILLPSCHLEEG